MSWTVLDGSQKLPLPLPIRFLPFRKPTHGNRYQLLTHQTSLESGRLVVKARLEKELDDLEADLCLLTRGPVAVAP